jgi:ketosteroid isomerase-like protein
VEHDDAMDMLRSICAAFDRHDLDAIMAHFAEDAVFESPRGPDRWGQRFVGVDQIREAFAGRFSGIPDVRYQDDDHFVDGDCDLWTIRDGKVVKKDSFWKIRTTA